MSRIISRSLAVKFGPLLLSCGLWVLLLAGGGSQGLAQEQGTFARVLFLGNSITKHGPKPSIDWHGDYGMAASSQDKDYVHVVVQGLTAAQGRAPEVMIQNIAAFEREFETYDGVANLADAVKFAPTHIVLAIGENVPLPAKEETQKREALFKVKLLALLKSFTGTHKPQIVVRSCFWVSPVKDQILEDVCREMGGVFVDLRSFKGVESYYARAERPYKNAGVGNHPGDAGMRAIAEAILAKMVTK